MTSVKYDNLLYILLYPYNIIILSFTIKNILFISNTETNGIQSERGIKKCLKNNPLVHEI